jgi:hypothetical protein
MKAISKDLISYYTHNLKNFGPSAQGVGWKNEAAQVIRFEQITKIINENSGFSINDLGCGVADYFAFLNNRQFSNFIYKGYDVLDDMIESSSAKYADIKNAQFYKIADASQLEQADYTIASGIFNLKYNTSETEWIAYILKTIEWMSFFSLKGFSFNILTRYADKEFMQSHLYYADPLFFFDFCKRTYSKNVALLHDYNEYDFTILVRK